MEIVRDTPFEIGLQVWQARPPVRSLTVVVKGTFELVAGAPCRLAAEQAPVTGDVYQDDEPEGSLRYPSDLAWLKPRGECLLVGEYHSPAGAPTTATQVGFRVGALRKDLVLVGDRHWKGGLFGGLSEPVPFVVMPLCWERSFGGHDVPENPVGRGIAAVEVDGQTQIPLPNIEDRQRLVTSKRDRPRPAGAFPIHPAWRGRAKHLGTYDRGWQKARFPWLPLDFQWEHFCAAPEDQRLAGFFRGDEEIEATHLVAGHPRVASTLPGLQARCFLAPRGDGPLREVSLALDTVSLEAPSGKVFAIWRGVTEVPDGDFDDLFRLFVTHEPLAAPSTVEACRARFAACLATAEGEELDFEAVPPPDEAPSLTPLRIGASATPESARLRAQVVEALAAGRPLSGFFGPAADLSGLDLRGVDLSGAVLRGADLRCADLSNATLDEAVLIEAHLDRAKVAGTSFRAADLSGVQAPGLRFEGACLDQAVAVDANFRACHFIGARAAGAELSGSDLEGAELVDCLLDKADLARCRLEGAKLVRCTLVEASMEGGAAAPASVFEGCDLSRLRASDGADFTGAIFRGSTLTGARFAEARMARANLSFAELAQADFSDAELTGALLLGCNLRGARFDRARLDGAQLCRSDLLGARFEEAVLSRADLRGCNLYGAELLAAKTDGTLLELANLEGTKLA